MSRQPQDVIKQQLGSLMTEIAILTSQLEQKDEEIAALKAQAGTAKELPNVSKAK